MQTFLPYPSFTQSALVLDRQRLGKQRVEALQIIFALTKENYGWKNHPAVKMWKNHVPALAKYGIIICDEWIKRGYKDSTREKFLVYTSNKNIDLPNWIGDCDFHKAHQSKLLSKKPDWYTKFNWDVPNDLPYIWPSV